MIIDDGFSRVLFLDSFLEIHEAEKLFNKLLVSLPWLRVGSREAYWIGDFAYMYSGAIHPPNPLWPDSLKFLMEGLKKSYDADVNSVLCNLYRSGRNCIPYHSDDEAILGLNPTIFSVSLGASRVFSLKKKADSSVVVEKRLSSGSLVIMSGKTQELWRHGILQDFSTRKARINLTFRKSF